MTHRVLSGDGRTGAANRPHPHTSSDDPHGKDNRYMQVNPRLQSLAETGWRVDDHRNAPDVAGKNVARAGHIQLA
jgi:hypothetical protein